MWIKATTALGYWVPVLAIGISGGTIAADSVPQFPGGGALTVIGFVLGTVWAASELKTTFKNKFTSLEDSLEVIKDTMVTKENLKAELLAHTLEMDKRYKQKEEAYGKSAHHN